MDRVSESLLNEFSELHGISSFDEETRFEHFAAYIATQRHYLPSFDAGDIVVGSGGDTGIDSIGIIVNEVLITDVEELKEQIADNTVDATFVFVQAERSPGFDAQKMGNFGFGVQDFFTEKPRLKRNEKLAEFAAISDALFKVSSKFRHGNPMCHLYYVTTGKWQGDANLEARREAIQADLESTGLFRAVTMSPIDASRLRALYMQSKNSVSKEFVFANKVVIPDTPNVDEAYLGFISANEFIKLIDDEHGEIIGGLFNENVRDWLDSNPVNDEIRATLESDERTRFVLMNNGITIIARTLRPTGNKFVIEDFSVVNGCQTSHALHSQKGKLEDTVMVPIRLICTRNEKVINNIIRATNRQTEVTTEQFYAIEEFSKELEVFFQAFPEPQKLYYERRTRQFHRQTIEKTRIVTPQALIKSYAAMFLEEPHRTTRNYAALKTKVGAEIFVKGHRMEPYYTSAFALYRLEYLFRSGKLESKYKAARFHILLAARIILQPGRPPRENSHEMERYCKPIMQTLWDAGRAEALLVCAAGVIEMATNGNFHRDNIRTEPFTKSVRSLAEAVRND